MLCMIRERGRLGFKKLRKFNLAMLAKQVWRLVNYSNPLVIKLMQARYYHKSDFFFSATLDNNSNYVYRSIVQTQEMMEEKCRTSNGVKIQRFERYRGYHRYIMDTLLQ